MHVWINDTNDIYVVDDTPDSEIRYRARFYFDPNSLTMGTGETLDLFTGYNGTTQVFHLQLQGNAGTYQLRSRLLDDASGNVLSQQRYLPFGKVRTDVGASL